VFIACTLLHWDAIIVLDKRRSRASMWCVNRHRLQQHAAEVLREIKERALVLLRVATRSPIAESACPRCFPLLHSRIFAGAQAAAAALRVDVRGVAEFKWHQASNPAGAVREG
jgi:hypothetical protein